MVPKSFESESIYEESSVSKKKRIKSEMVLLADFAVTHKIGSGAFSSVYKVINKKNNKVYALKQMNKDELLYRNQMKYAMTELSILKNCKNCPFIIPLGYAFQTENYLYLAIKYLPFGNLKEILTLKKTLEY